MPSRRGEIEPFLVMDVMRAAADREQAGERIIHMEVGQPGASAPAAAVAAAKRALADGKIGYSEALGRRDLRARISQYYREAHDLDVTPDRIAVTTGSSAGFNTGPYWARPISRTASISESGGASLISSLV